MKIRISSSLLVLTILLSGLATAAPPPAPAHLVATLASGQISLTWDASAGAVSYTVYRKLLANPDDAHYHYPVAKNDPPIYLSPLAAGVIATSYTDSAVTDGERYAYYVRAVNAGAEESESSNGLVTILTPVPPAPGKGSFGYLIPMPVSVAPAAGGFSLTEATDLHVSEGAERVGSLLASDLSTATGYTIKVVTTAGAPGSGHIYLKLDGGYEPGKPEAYRLEITPDLVSVTANSPAGLFRGTRTILQALPWQIHYGAALAGATWQMPAGTIEDHPRFGYRGYMLDCNGFLTMDEVKQLIDWLALYKCNYFHMHLADNWGWRVHIDAWPNLTNKHGDKFYSKAEFAELVAYADARHITIIPEFDMPGHSTHTVKTYPSLGSGKTLHHTDAVLDGFVTDVVSEIAPLLTGPYFHIGGDETNDPQFEWFIERAEGIIRAAGKAMIGWQEIGNATLDSSTVAEFWRGDGAFPGWEEALVQGNKLIFADAFKIYYDGKYNSDSPYGLNWMGHNSTQDSYEWDPSDAADEGMFIGVEPVIWTGIGGGNTDFPPEMGSVNTFSEAAFMTMPRLPGSAEVGWSPRLGRNWDEYRVRLGQHGNRMWLMNAAFFESTHVPWDLWYQPAAEPAGLVAVNIDDRVELDWHDVSIANLGHYKVYRGTSPGGPYTEIASSVAASDFTDTTGTDGTTYYYVVTSVDAGSTESGNSNEATGRRVIAPTISNSPATLIGSTIATLKGQVDDTGGQFPAITIHWGNDAGTESWDHSEVLGLRDDGSFAVAISSLTPGMTYHFRSFGQNDAGSGWANSSTSFTTLPATPAAPVNLTAVAGIGQVYLDWNDSGLPDFGSYTVYRSSTSGSGYTLLAEDLSDSFHPDTGVVSGNTYHYVMTVTNALGNESPQSNQTSGTVGSGSAAIQVNLQSPGRFKGGDQDSNGDIFRDFTKLDDYPGSTTGAATTTQIVAWSYDEETDTGVMSFQVDDRGAGGSGAVFTFDLEMHLFNTGPGTSDAKLRGGGVSSLNMADNDGRTEAAPSGGGREFLTLRLKNITNLSGPAVSVSGLATVRIIGLGEPDNAGILYAEGDASKTPVGKWGQTRWNENVDAGGLAEVTLEPTGDGFGVQGFTATFECKLPGQEED